MQVLSSWSVPSLARCCSVAILVCFMANKMKCNFIIAVRPIRLQQQGLAVTAQVGYKNYIPSLQSNNLMEPISVAYMYTFIIVRPTQWLVQQFIQGFFCHRQASLLACFAAMTTSRLYCCCCHWLHRCRADNRRFGRIRHSDELVTQLFLM